MIFDWYKIINKADFEEMEIPSVELELNLEDLGVKTILVTMGNRFNLSYDDVFLSADLNDQNPFVFEGYAIYRDSNDDIFLGKQVVEN